MQQLGHGRVETRFLQHRFDRHRGIRSRVSGTDIIVASVISASSLASVPFRVGHGTPQERGSARLLLGVQTTCAEPPKLGKLRNIAMTNIRFV